ncbi:MAG: hypothetical protein P4L50_09825 [Anaerolineaceae bacterium]|nr:hypothetical protein [Anaerolineaceae bacterium]
MSSNFRAPYEVAIDPLAQLLPSSILQYLWEYLHPHTPLTEALDKAVAKMTPEEKGLVLARAQLMMNYSKMVHDAVSKSE